MGKIVAITPPFYDLGCGYVAGADYTPGNGTQAEFSPEGREKRPTTNTYVSMEEAPACVNERGMDQEI